MIRPLWPTACVTLELQLADAAAGGAGTAGGLGPWTCIFAFSPLCFQRVSRTLRCGEGADCDLSWVGSAGPIFGCERSGSGAGDGWLSNTGARRVGRDLPGWLFIRSALFAALNGALAMEIALGDFDVLPNAKSPPRVTEGFSL